MDFPRLVYKSASVYTLVEDQATIDAFIADGWFATVPEALEKKSAPVVTVEESEAPVKRKPGRPARKVDVNELD